MDAINRPRVALVHDWLTGMRGGEKCLEVACRRWPDAPLYTLLHRRGSVSPIIEQRSIHTSPLQYLPRVDQYYRNLLPLMPAALRMLRLAPCDLVLSFSHCVAKAIRVPRDVPHVCYCFSPMRYAWHMQDAYFGAGRMRGIKARLIEVLLGHLRDWDRKTAASVTHFIAISQTVRQRIADCYDRESTVIYPPVDTDFYTPALVSREDYYLVVSAFAPYKRIDLAIQACSQLGRRLVVIGKGQDAARLHQLAGPEVEFLGWQPDDVIRAHLRRCRALLFPGEEDFGIVPVEAMACGTPVIALEKGGATETVIGIDSRREPTGLFFRSAEVEHLIDALQQFEMHRNDFHPAAARRQALRFNAERFATELFHHLDQVLAPKFTSQTRAA